MFEEGLELLAFQTLLHWKQYPVHSNPWSGKPLNLETRTEIINQVGQVLEQVLDSGTIQYPSFTETENVEFIRGYGLRWEVQRYQRWGK